MNPAQLRRLLEAQLQGWEGRPYLGMSQIGQCPRRLYDDLVNGRRRPNRSDLRYCHEGYLHEVDVYARLEAAGLQIENRQQRIDSFDPRFLGHIDGTIDGDLMEIKSCSSDALAIVRERGVLYRHRAQVQCYMHFGHFERCFVVYKDRNNGSIWVVLETRDPEAGKRIEERARAILCAVDTRTPPACVCGRCLTRPARTRTIREAAR